MFKWVVRCGILTSPVIYTSKKVSWDSYKIYSANGKAKMSIVTIKWSLCCFRERIMMLSHLVWKSASKFYDSYFSLSVLFRNWVKAWFKCRLSLSWRSSLSCRNQSNDLPCKSMYWFLYDGDLLHERVNPLKHQKIQEVYKEVNGMKWINIVHSRQIYVQN